MDLDRYQQGAIRTAQHPGREHGGGLSYLSNKLASEAGEVAGKIGKRMLRDDTEIITVYSFTEDERVALAQELGDVLWYIAAMSDVLGFCLSDVGKMNLDKLADREARGVIIGDGDNR